MIEPRSPNSSAVVLAAVVAAVVLGLVVDATTAGTREVLPGSQEVPLLAGSTTCAAVSLSDASHVTATTVAAPDEDTAADDPGTEAPATEATGTEATGTEAPATEAPATETGATPTATEASAATPPGATEATDGSTTDEVPASGDAAAVDPHAPTAELRLEHDGTTRRLATPATDGGAVATAVAGSGDEVALAARWEDAPLLLSRRWAIDSTDRVPGTVEGPCPTEPATQWVVPGVATAGGAAARLHIANPTDGPASLAVTFTTPDGPVAPTRLANLAVPAHDQITVDLNQFVPEEPDLGVVVTTRAGRVVAEVMQTLEAAVGGVDGRSLVPAAPEAREVWTIPWVRASEQETAWVWVTNPGEEATDVRLVLHTETGPVVPPDSGVTLAPGTTQRIDLRGALGELGTAAVTIRSAPGVPVVASGAVLRAVEDDPVRGGVTVVEALPAVRGMHAALSAVGATGRERLLAVANPGEQEARVDVSVVGRSAAATHAVATDLVVPAGGLVLLDLDEDLPLEGGFAVVVDAVEGVAAATMVSTDLEGPLNLTAVAAHAFPTTVRVTERALARDRSLLHPIAREEFLESGEAQGEDDGQAEQGDAGAGDLAPSPGPSPAPPPAESPPAQSPPAESPTAGATAPPGEPTEPTSTP